MSKAKTARLSIRVSAATESWLSLVAGELELDISDVVRECIATVMLATTDSDVRRAFKRHLRQRFMVVKDVKIPSMLSTDSNLL